MNKTKVETWLGTEIRFVEANGEWYAIAKDVAKALDYNKTTNMNRMIDEDDKGVHNVSTPGGNQKVTTISEFGIYEAIFNSRKPEAKEFKKWVKQVIKSLRESTGLEGFEVFRMMDKEIQKEASRFIHEGLDNIDKKHHQKMNTIANKATSNIFGLDKLVKKEEMTPDMLEARQPIVKDVAQLMVANDKYDLGLSISSTIYNKHCKEDN